MELVVQELTVGAPPRVVCELWTDPARSLLWTAADATLDPRSGGVVRWTHANGYTCSGDHVQLVGSGGRLVLTRCSTIQAAADVSVRRRRFATTPNAMSATRPPTASRKGADPGVVP